MCCALVILRVMSRHVGVAAPLVALALVGGFRRIRRIRELLCEFDQFLSPCRVDNACECPL